MNSKLDGHISVYGYGDTSEGATPVTRYYGGLSSAAIPGTTATLKFYEYNNTGDGAITQEVVGMSFLTAEQAKAYALFANANREISADAKIFLKTGNPNLHYAEDWVPGARAATILITIVDATSGAAGETVGAIVVNADSTVTEEQMRAVVIVPQGKLIAGFYSDVAGTAFDFASPVGTTDLTVYVKFEENTGITAFFTADSYDVGVSLRDKVAPFDVKSENGTTLLQIVKVEGGDSKSAEYSATATDSSGYTFSKVFLPGGNDRTITLKAEMDITLTVYFTATDGSWANKQGHLQWTITNGLGVTGEKQTGEQVSSAASNAIAQQITLSAGDTVVLSLDVSARLALYGLYAITR